MFLNISLNKKQYYIILLFIITIFVFAIYILILLSKTEKIKNGKIFDKNLELSFDEYYVESEMTVISNKNINTYKVKEWHKEGKYTKLEYLDTMKNIVTILLEGNSCNISNSGNVAKFVINNMADNKNITSLSTFSKLYNNKEEACCCNKTKHIKEKELILTIEFNEKCNCKYNKIFHNLQISSVQLITEENIPKNYIIYNKNKKEYISIIYNIYKNNF